jgi:hypothetical protein
MGLLGHRPYWFSKTNGVDRSHVAPLQPQLLWKNFSICPHCRKQGRHDVLEALDEDGPNCPGKQNISVSTFAKDTYTPSQQIYILNPHIPNFSSTCSCAIKHFNHGTFAEIAGT